MKFPSAAHSILSRFEIGNKHLDRYHIASKKKEQIFYNAMACKIAVMENEGGAVGMDNIDIW